MQIIFVIVFAINIISIILMAYEFKKHHIRNGGFYDKNVKYTVAELREHKETIRILIYLGAAGGILLWGNAIGLITTFSSTDFQRLLNCFNFSATLAFLPSTLGLLNIYKLRKSSENQH